MTSSCCNAYTRTPEWGRCPKCFEHCTFTVSKVERAVKLLLTIKDKKHGKER